MTSGNLETSLQLVARQQRPTSNQLVREGRPGDKRAIIRMLSRHGGRQRSDETGHPRVGLF